jgi:EthD domain
MFKLMILPHTRTGMSRAELRQHLEHVHGPLCLVHPDVSGYFRRYQHHYAVDATVPPFGIVGLEGRDALTVICFDDMAAMITSKASAGYRDAIGPDEDNFREEAGSITLSAVETMVIPADPDATQKLFIFRKLARSGPDAVQDWAARVGARLGDRVAGYTVNAVTALGGDANWNVLDEIVLRDGPLPQGDIEHVLAQGAIASLLTVAKRFV